MPEIWWLDSAELTLELQRLVHQIYLWLDLRIVVTCSVIAAAATCKHIYIHTGTLRPLKCKGHRFFNKGLACSIVQLHVQVRVFIVASSKNHDPPKDCVALGAGAFHINSSAGTMVLQRPHCSADPNMSPSK